MFSIDCEVARVFSIGKNDSIIWLSCLVEVVENKKLSWVVCRNGYVLCELRLSN